MLLVNFGRAHLCASLGELPLTESLTAKLTDRCNGKVKIEKLKSGYVEF